MVTRVAVVIVRFCSNLPSIVRLPCFLLCDNLCSHYASSIHIHLASATIESDYGSAATWLNSYCLEHCLHSLLSLELSYKSHLGGVTNCAFFASTMRISSGDGFGYEFLRVTND